MTKSSFLAKFTKSESESNPFFDLSQDLNLMTLLSKITSKNKHSSDELEDEVVGSEVW